VIIAQLALSLTIVAAAVSAIRATSLIRAAISLALGNSALALFFFVLRAPLAGSVQLSVGAGVVSALFLLAISLTETMGGAAR
jgi:NADH:ubiquinone oxidoreductase subunit 6 (subunit J)